MIKQIAASLFLLSLIVVFIYNVKEDNSKGTEVQSEAESAYMVAPNAEEGLKAGQTAPDFKLEGLNGDSFHLSDLRGKKVIINFWATWCGPCEEEMPSIQKVEEKYKGEVEILAVNATNTELGGINKVKEFVNRGRFTFDVLLDNEAEVTESYRVLNIPTTYFIDRDGIISEVISGPMTLDYMEETLQKM
ncbi:redoxin domain-containing protein [Sediminibacillus massiliensis]|uniref:redoxin domain-containing protein n=1 Tax=Sediminibacillus massiliensis TaxID=1926277 RepID=UPI001FE79C92|nr:redoxin domain-containing protein [Sediminibacillus massiliensis]